MGAVCGIVCIMGKDSKFKTAIYIDFIIRILIYFINKLHVNIVYRSKEIIGKQISNIIKWVLLFINPFIF